MSILRPFNTYGPRQSRRAIIPEVISQISQNKNKLKLGNLSPTRDFNFVEDTCEAFMQFQRQKILMVEVLNAASNFEISIKETVYLISELMMKNIEMKDSQKVRPNLSEVNSFSDVIRN